ncbi:uncharacterized protein LOC122301701 [Carya illinoinensis]|uniref:uncharacterized protein LOC122301701 n=1 Tax=Carya illinoinensis TaxID=32201 RepID=UPI001C71F68F|nr:uncharacterized protein LOC122301701 [Carya illinoinensis]
MGAEMDERWRNIWNLEVPSVCPASDDIWAKVGCCVQKWGRTEEEFLLLWGKLMERLSMKKLEEMIVLLRRVWLHRNEFVFKKKLGYPKILVKTAVEGLLEYKIAQILTKQVVKGQNSNARSVIRWEKPESGCVKVNWDASLNLKERRMGAGIIVRDEKGKALVVVCDQKVNVDSLVVAECFALRMAIELCSELNIHKAIFEGDARIVIEAV